MAFVSLGGFVVVVYATPTSYTTVIEEGSGVETASYAIFPGLEGSTYYAKNGSTGAIDYSGSDATTVINNALANGGTTFLKSGTYIIEGVGTPPGKLGIAIPSNASLIGEDMFTTILRQADGANINRFITTNPPTTVETDIEISNLKIDGNYDNQDYSALTNADYKVSGIVTYGDRWKMTNLWIVDCGMYGGITAHGGDSVIENIIVEDTHIYNTESNIEWYGTGMFLSGVHTLYNYSNIMVNNVLIKNVEGIGFFLEDMVNTNTITNVIIENSGWDGFRVQSCNNTINNIQIRNSAQEGMVIRKAKGPEASYNTISNCRIEYSNLTGMHIYGGKYNDIYGNQFILNARGNYTGNNRQLMLDMAAGAAGWTNCTRNNIYGNTFLSDSAVSFVIQETNDGQDYNYVYGNILDGTPSVTEISLRGANSWQKNNFLDAGTVQSASGQQEASNTDWINFGAGAYPATYITFSGTPQVFLTVEESDDAYIAQPYNVNTTHFQLFLADDTGAAENVDKTINWQAIYQP